MAHNDRTQRRPSVAHRIRWINPPPQQLQKPPPAPRLRLPPCPPGHLCEVCGDAPARWLQPMPGGGDRGVCTVCAVSAQTRSESV